MVDNTENKVLIREYNEDTDMEVVGKLEKNCEIGSNKEVSLFTNMKGDPLCRIRFYPIHVMLVAELRENGKLVGVVKGCIKHVGTRFGSTYVRLGSILGLRVSPEHRRMGIGLKLVKAVEDWLMVNGAQYTFLATEKNNEASSNLASKCNYINWSSLIIFVQPADLHTDGLSQDIKIEKLQIDQAIHLYNTNLRGKDMYPTDLDAILKERLSIGTWVSYFKDEECMVLPSIGRKQDLMNKTPSSWAMFSIWNSREAYKLRIRRSCPLKFFHATLTHARDKIFPCLKLPICDSLQNPFGFLFLYGLYGEGDRLKDLMKSILSFASRVAENVKDCKVVVTELGQSDPLINYMPQNPSMSCINDLWYLKKLKDHTSDNKNEQLMTGEVGNNVFVDPRDF